MTTLHLPRLDGATAHGWLATIGAVRVLSEQWPTMHVSWGPGEHGSLAPTLHDGPTSVDETVQVLLERTVHAVEPGGVLPGCPDGYPPPGRDWFPGVRGSGWGGPGSAAESWHAAIQCPVTGQLNPMLRPHAAQTPRSMFGKARAAVAHEPDLLRHALAGPGYGLTPDYPGGLWLLRAKLETGAMASPGYDWLALMALPWLAARDSHEAFEPGAYRPEPRGGAVGWTWHYARSRQPRLTWRLWTRPLPAAAVPAVVDLHKTRGHAPLRVIGIDGPEFAWEWEVRRAPQEPPVMTRVPPWAGPVDRG